jgi:hypothetical protein
MGRTTAGLECRTTARLTASYLRSRPRPGVLHGRSLNQCKINLYCFDLPAFDGRKGQEQQNQQRVYADGRDCRVMIVFH